MIVLAIDTAGETASVAVRGKDGRIYQKKNKEPLDHLKSLILLVSSVLSEHGIEKKELEALAVSAGPGSFTGIRIGMAAARTLAQVLGIRVAPVMTLEAYLYNDYGIREEYLLCPLTDARRGNVFAAAYEMPERRKAVPEGLYNLEKFIEGLPDGKRLVFTGSGAVVYRDTVRECVEKKVRKKGRGTENLDSYGASVCEYDIDDFRHDAACVLRCAEDRQSFVEYQAAEPVYLRKSEAEVKRAEGKLGLRARKRKEEERQKILDMPPAEEPLVYRSLTEEDAPSLAALDALCFGKSWKEDAFLGDLRGSKEAYYEGAFNSSGKLIGFAGAVSLLGEGEVNRVAVHPLYRTRGIGGACLDRVIGRMTGDGTETIFLEVREANRSAITLYKNAGFRVISKRKNYYQETGENALIMQWRGEERTE